MSIATYSKKEAKECIKVLKEARKTATSEKRLGESPCTLLLVKDGRLTKDRVKIAFGYQVACLGKYGSERCRNLKASKQSNDETISHLCGTRNCINPDHLFLEAKKINDERTHCHFVLNTYLEKTGRRCPEKILVNLCCHTPLCTHDDRSDDDDDE